MGESTEPELAFHRGERAIQARLGVERKMSGIGLRAIRDTMPDQHRIFFAQLPSMYIATADSNGDIWASVLHGEPGFVYSLNPNIVRINAKPLPLDPLYGAVANGADLGLLGIELSTRRRNRLNANVVTVDDSGIELQVKQSFGNCPKYIQRRETTGAKSDQAPIRHDSDKLTPESESILSSADTLFIASGFDDGAGKGNRGFDVSHRGGQPGFIQQQDEQNLWIPDYAGNNFFNTFGNLQLDPRAGLLVPDFIQGQLLYLSGEACVHWAEDAALPITGVPRALQFSVRRVVRIEHALPQQWVLQEYSPFAELYQV